MTLDNQKYVLYGMPGSLYTAKVRCYLRKQRIAFDERVAGDPRFTKEVVPAVKRWIIPVVQTPDGELLQDGTCIIDHLEASAPMGPRAQPPDPVLSVISHIFEMFGSEGMLRPAMHYRWNFDDVNLAFLKGDFLAALAPGQSGDEAEMTFAFASDRMRKATKRFGVNADTAGNVESSFEEFLQLFDRHLQSTPYLLGPDPTYADYGLIGPLHAHLARDPYPSQLLKCRAPRVWRWVERMNAPDSDEGEYLGQAPDWFNVRQLPDSLFGLLRFIAQDYLTEVQAHVDFANQWLANQSDSIEGTNGMPKPGDRHIGNVQFDWRGHNIEVVVMPYRIFMLQRIQDSAEALDAAQKSYLQDILQASGLQSLLTTRCHRRVERKGFLEVWGSKAT